MPKQYAPKVPRPVPRTRDKSQDSRLVYQTIPARPRKQFRPAHPTPPGHTPPQYPTESPESEHEAVPKQNTQWLFPQNASASPRAAQAPDNFPDREEEAYRQFSGWLRSQDQSRELEALFFEWAMAYLDSGQLEPDEQLQFELDLSGIRSAVLSRVRLDRIQSAQSEFGEAPQGKVDLLSEIDQLSISMVERIGNSGGALLTRNADPMRPDQNLFAHWVELRKEIYLIQDQMIDGSDAELLSKTGRDRLRWLSTWLHAKATQEVGQWSSGQQRDWGPWSKTDVAELNATLDLPPSQSRNLQLLFEFAELSFALGEFIGQVEQKQHQNDALQGREGDRMAFNRGKVTTQVAERGRLMTEYAREYPFAQRIDAYFIPREFTDTHANPREKAQPLTFYARYDTDSEAWILDDLTTIRQQKQNRVSGTPDQIPEALFAELNTRLRFPKGHLLYQVPGESSYEIMETTGEMSWHEWLSWAGTALLILGAAVATGGASVPATMLIATGALATAGGEIGAMQEKHQHGMLETQDVLLHGTAIASSLLAGAGATTRLFVTKGAAMASGHAIRTGEHIAVRYFAQSELAADVVGMLVFTADAYAELSAAAESGMDGDTLARMALFYLALGTVNAVGVRGGMGEVKGRAVLDVEGGGLVLRKDISELPEKLETQRVKLQARSEKVSQTKAATLAFWEDLKRAFPEAFASQQVQDAAEIIHAQSFYGSWDRESVRALFGIIGKMARTVESGARLTVETVILYLQKRGLEIRYLTHGEHRELIALLIDDVEMKGLGTDDLEFIHSYRGFFQNSSLTNFELSAARKNGFSINPKTGRLIQDPGRPLDFEAAALVPEARTSSVELPDNFKAEDHPELAAMIAQREARRSHFRQLRDAIEAKKAAGQTPTQAEIDALNKARNQIGRSSEAIGEATLDIMLTGQGYRVIYPLRAKSSGSGDLDRVYLKQLENGRYQVVEVKGGSNTLSSRRVRYIPQFEGKNLRAQQGSPQYLLDVLLEMGESKDKEARETAIVLIRSIRSENLDYLFFKQSFASQGKLGKHVFEQFDISRIQSLLTGI